MKLHERVTPFWQNVVVVMTILGVLLTINQVFFLSLFGITLIQSSFLYLLLACFLPLVPIIYPVIKKDGAIKVPSIAWYDIALSLLTFFITFYFGLKGKEILINGWSMNAPILISILSIIFWFIVLEALRRTAGLTVALIAFTFSIYPMFADKVPISFLNGVSFNFLDLASSHSLGGDSILGLPMQAAGVILVGFIIFGVVLQKTGGATFFFKMAQSIFGRTRGGEAKVAVVSSAFMGMMSGSAVSNVLTTGPMTIPAMKEAGYDPEYAAGIEATASSGGSITPPIMGSAAFLMVTFVGVPYYEIAVAATIPAFLFFLGIMVQIDIHAKKKGLVGLPKSELPKFLSVLKDGWPFLFSLILLIYLLVVTQLEAQAPFYTIAFLIITSFFYKNDRMNFSKLKDIIYQSGRAVSEIFGILAGVGLIVGGLSLTGVSLSLSRELVSLVGDSVFLILLAGAITSFILGMGMTISAVYVLLAVVMAPALVAQGVHPLAAHLYVIYWASVSYITPPVALASFAAAGIAGSDPMKTSITAMKLGAVKYIIPIAFALSPTLIAQGELKDILISLVSAIVGVFFMGCGFEGYITIFNLKVNYVERILIVIAGFCLILPSLWLSIGGALFIIMMLLYLKQRQPFRGSVMDIV